ncbi:MULTISPECIES: hypothetical protein [Hydrogenophaga]|uniref:hypothetical protein n=1 Tax=Hydrogenophaga TaxID=47420 RepID=UPI001CFA6278|nr:MULTISPECIES: hypothetical protein [Hydrogenophaga]MDO9030459.1 hypothetical protein [Hydrogenophaga sp.]MDP2022483.1 hypothetical protein [Hydrogenophaga sp.]UCU95289.1 hypothetical protein KI616_05365 [Hydrogenophaga taeniospiralis]
MFVTDATSGIGGAITDALLFAGAAVVMAGINGKRLAVEPLPDELNIRFGVFGAVSAMQASAQDTGSG